ncbi:MAG: alpha-E domain-containing protein, partial [Candidatus Competibacteraceae bacterium]|nr:alpha-E domain-containing protein [Candidatus Competibacteraceae bacterium]
SANLLPRPGQAASQTQTQDATEGSLSQNQGAVVPEREEQDPFESIQWMSVLKSLSAYQIYRQQVRLRVGGPDVLKFLLQNEFFPRAVACCLKQLEVCLLELPGNTVPLAGIAALKHRLNSAMVPELAHEGLHEFIDELQVGFGELHGQIAATYFAH